MHDRGYFTRTRLPRVEDQMRVPGKETWIERALEKGLFSSRWLLAPFYVGLVIALAMLLIVFLRIMVNCIIVIMACMVRIFVNCFAYGIHFHNLYITERMYNTRRLQL